MTAAEKIARTLGGAHRSGRWWSCRCPAHDDRSPSLSLRDGDHRLIVKCWAGCDPREVLAELRQRSLLVGDIAEYRPPPAPTVRTDRNVEIARWIWDEARDARDTPAEGYLADRDITTVAPASLRYAPSLWRRDGPAGPGMVARIDGPGGEFWGVHRTWICRDAAGVWRRCDRSMLGRATGGAVRLAPAGESLAVGEGVETTLAAMVGTGIPGWAALSANGIERLILPPLVRHVVILADHDVSGAGERASRSAGQRWLAEGRRVRIALPPEPGTDMADVLAGRIDTKARGVAA
jgi:hypothetical protein